MKNGLWSCSHHSISYELSFGFRLWLLIGLSFTCEIHTCQKYEITCSNFGTDDLVWLQLLWVVFSGLEITVCEGILTRTIDFLDYILMLFPSLYIYGKETLYVNGIPIDFFKLWRWQSCLYTTPRAIFKFSCLSIWDI